MSDGWIGVDLDGTLAHYDEWRGIEHVGKPIPAMVERVKGWLLDGKDVRIVTARMGTFDACGNWLGPMALAAIQKWCRRHLGRELTVTDRKDYGMIELWDDRAVRVVTNTGERCCDGNQDPDPGADRLAG